MRYWMWGKSVWKVLNMWKFMKVLYWNWENFVTYVMKKRKLLKRCTACGKNLRDVLNERYAESEKIVQEMYCMWENHERCTEWEKNL